MAIRQVLVLLSSSNRSVHQQQVGPPRYRRHDPCTTDRWRGVRVEFQLKN